MRKLLLLINKQRNPFPISLISVNMKKSKAISYLVLFLFAIVISACSDGSNDVCCVIIDTNIQVLYKNDQGESLINSNDAFDESNIKIYYKDGEEFEYIYQGHLDHPNMYRLDENQNAEIVLTVFPSNYYQGNLSTTLIELNANTIDTLVCEFELEANREICTRAWLNGVEMENRFIEIEK